MEEIKKQMEPGNKTPNLVIMLVPEKYESYVYHTLRLFSVTHQVILSPNRLCAAKAEELIEMMVKTGLCDRPKERDRIIKTIGPYKYNWIYLTKREPNHLW